MSETEMKTLWGEQSIEPNSNNELNTWLKKIKRRETVNLAVVIAGLVIGYSVLALRIYSFIADDQFRFADASLDVFIASIPAISSTIAAVAYLHELKKAKTAQSSVSTCLRHFLKTTQGEIKAFKRGAPIASIGVLALVAASKWQTISTGRETVENAGGGFVVALLLVIAGLAIHYHYYAQYLLPRQSHLQKTLTQCEDLD